MSTVVDRAVDFVKNYQGLEPKNGKISEESLAKFVQDLEKVLDRESFGKVNGELLPYCGEGYMGEANIPMWQLVDAICKGNKYQYISSTDLGNLTNIDDFTNALKHKGIKGEQFERVIWGNGQLEVKEGSGVLNLGDYLSKRIMSEVACGDVLYQNSQSMLCFVSFFYILHR